MTLMQARAVAALGSCLLVLGAVPQAAPDSQASHDAIRQVVADYTGLYAAGTLERWKTLFHPGLGVVSPQADGAARVRGLEEFFAAQKDYFKTGRSIRERLENIRIDAGRRIARVSADFVVSDEGVDSRGRLGLHLVDERGAWKIVAIIFSYDEA